MPRIRYPSVLNKRQPLDGIEQKTLVHGDKTLMAEFRLQKGAILPLHSHPHEQIGYLVKGNRSIFFGFDRRWTGSVYKVIRFFITVLHFLRKHVFRQFIFIPLKKR